MSFLNNDTLNKYINEAYNWLRDKRGHHSSNSDIWHLRFHWLSEKEKILTALRNCNHQFSPRQQYRFKDETLSLYASKDSLVLKMIAFYLGDEIQKKKSVSKHCYHIKNNGGLKKAVRNTKERLGQYRYVFKSDIKSYYALFLYDHFFSL